MLLLLILTFRCLTHLQDIYLILLKQMLFSFSRASYELFRLLKALSYDLKNSTSFILSDCVALFLICLLISTILSSKFMNICGIFVFVFVFVGRDADLTLKIFIFGMPLFIDSSES